MKIPFKRLLFKCLMLMMPFLIIFELLYRLGINPSGGDRATFDRKMFEIQRHRIRDVKIMSMGSSISLFEFNSEMIVHDFPSYYNFSSMGMHMADFRAQLNVFVPEHHPEYVILGSSVNDFMSGPDSAFSTYLNTSRWIRDNFPEYFYLRNFQPILELVYRRALYDMDAWGGMSITEVDSANWNRRDQLPTDKTADAYRQLDSIAKFLQEQHVKLIFVQAPIKAAYANTPALAHVLAAHFDTCRSIVGRRGGVYLNYYNTAVFADSLFSDQVHLLAAGGKIMTKELLADLKHIIPTK